MKMPYDFSRTPAFCTTRIPFHLRTRWGFWLTKNLGNWPLVDHVGFEATLSDKKERYEQLQHLFSRTMFYSHRNKQAWGAYKPMKGKRFARVEEHLYSGNLERNKQDALHVGFSNNRILVPTRFRPSYAYNHLKFTLGCFKAIGELPFVALGEKSTKGTRNHVAKILFHLRTMFSALPRPKTVGRYH